jgi:hypothetical protein
MNRMLVRCSIDKFRKVVARLHLVELLFGALERLAAKGYHTIEVAASAGGVSRRRRAGRRVSLGEICCSKVRC